MPSNLRYGLIGSGSWATAIAKMVLTNKEHLSWWVRREETREHLMEFGRNPHYIQSIAFDPNKLTVSNSMQEIIDASDVLIFAIPSIHLDEVIQAHDPKGMEDKIIINAIKGMVVEYDSIPARYLHKQFNVPYKRIGLLAGPCHAEEVAREKLSYLTMACPDLELARNLVRSICHALHPSSNQPRCGGSGVGGGAQEYLRHWCRNRAWDWGMGTTFSAFTSAMLPKK